MSQVYYGVNVGQHTQDVEVATSTNSTDVELRVNTANALTREQADLALQAIANALLQNVYPFA